MKEEKNIVLAKEWFAIGKNELGFARAGLEDLDAFYQQVCFQCQQAVEKHLKGYLVYCKIKFPKIHDLIELIKTAAKTDKHFLKFLDGAGILSQYYLTSRYPIQYPPAGKKEAEEALFNAEKIIEFIQSNFKVK